MTLDRFARRITVIADKVEGGAHKVKREAALLALREVVLATPVDTGRARGNWIVQNGAPSLGTKEPDFPGEKGSTAAQNAQRAIDSGSATISVNPEIADIYISNNLAYIGRLNEGSSVQAPAKFIESAVDRAVRHVRKTRMIT